MKYTINVSISFFVETCLDGIDGFRRAKESATQQLFDAGFHSFEFLGILPHEDADARTSEGMGDDRSEEAARSCYANA